MSRGNWVAALLVALPALVLPMLPAKAAQVDSTDLARCHAVAGRDERLSCYEALTEAALAAAATAPAANAGSGGPTGARAAAVGTAIGSSAPGTPAAGTQAPAVSAGGASAAGASVPGAFGAGAAVPPAHPVDPNDPANFGLSRHQLDAHAAVGGPSSIKTEVAQITEDRQHKITVVLENGQTWVFIEPESRLRPGDTVTIKRASLGSFLMLTPSRRSYRVERVK